MSPAVAILCCGMIEYDMEHLGELASLLGGGGLHTQMNPLAGGLGGTTSLLVTSGVPNELAGLCALLGNQQSQNVSLTNLQVVELQRDVAAQKLATEQQAASAVQAKIDEKVAEALKTFAPSNPPAQAVQSVQPDKKKPDGDGDLSSSRSGSSQGARRRAKQAERAQDLLTYKEAYEIGNGTTRGFNGTRGYSSEDDARGTRSTISGLRTSQRQAQARLQSRDQLVEDVLERLRTTRSPHRQGASSVQGNGGHPKATMYLF